MPSAALRQTVAKRGTKLEADQGSAEGASQTAYYLTNQVK